MTELEKAIDFLSKHSFEHYHYFDEYVKSYCLVNNVVSTEFANKFWNRYELKANIQISSRNYKEITSTLSNDAKSLLQHEKMSQAAILLRIERDPTVKTIERFGKTFIKLYRGSRIDKPFNYLSSWTFNKNVAMYFKEFGGEGAELLEVYFPLSSVVHFGSHQRSDWKSEHIYEDEVVIKQAENYRQYISVSTYPTPPHTGGYSYNNLMKEKVFKSITISREMSNNN